MSCSSTTSIDDYARGIASEKESEDIMSLVKTLIAYTDFGPVQMIRVIRGHYLINCTCDLVED